jgi:hypothetical protein
LFLAILLHFRGQSSEVCMLEMIIYLGSLRYFESDELLSTSMRGLPIFVVACMSIPTTYSDTPLKIEFDEPNFIDMRELSIFSSMPCGIHAKLTFGSF